MFSPIYMFLPRSNRALFVLCILYQFSVLNLRIFLTHLPKNILSIIYYSLKYLTWQVSQSSPITSSPNDFPCYQVKHITGSLKLVSLWLVQLDPSLWLALLDFSLWLDPLNPSFWLTWPFSMSCPSWCFTLNNHSWSLNHSLWKLPSNLCLWLFPLAPSLRLVQLDSSLWLVPLDLSLE